MPPDIPGPLPPPPTDPDDVAAFIEAIDPAVTAASATGDLGSVIAELPGEGTKALGEGMQVQADMVKLGANTASFSARAVQAYIEAQANGLQAVFPPPQEVVAHLQSEAQQVQGAFQGPPEEPPGGL